MVLGNAPRRWLPLVGAIVAIVLAACGDATPAATTGPGDTTATSVSSGDDGGQTTGEVSLDEAITAVGTRYAFAATVTLDGSEVTRVEGVVYDGVGAYEVSSGGTTVDYVASDDGQWARQAGSEWTALAEAAPLIDPLDPLTRPLAVTVLETVGDDALVEATYDGATLGFATAGEVLVTVTITDGVVSVISYDVAVGGGIATVITTFDGTADVSPIQVPPA